MKTKFQVKGKEMGYGVMDSYGDGDLSSADTMSLSGATSMGQKADFDRRKKKKYASLELHFGGQSFFAHF